MSRATGSLEQNKARFKIETGTNVNNGHSTGGVEQTKASSIGDGRQRQVTNWQRDITYLLLDITLFL